MVMEYITAEETVILAVLPAYVDFTTCECINLAQSVDKSGERTIGVVTKIDRADKGILAKIKAEKKMDLRLRLGCIPVRNRTQEEVEKDVSSTEIRAKEATFFRDHEELKHLSEDKRGMDALAGKLADIQLERLLTTMPKLGKQIADRLKDVKAQFDSLGEVWCLVEPCFLNYGRQLGHKVGQQEDIFRGPVWPD
eukprot:TRINITY_DN2035_c0_g1_i2.p2 TRINITY_DN2035_c0_g1~~TRINITY_DN2035_c0_g1_i2.p2  ORF type:complete len:195 (+),score=24.89 TRINITY_DN2035_c0_g1_i2:151-735(+)